MAQPSEVGPEILEKFTLGQVGGQCLFEKSDQVKLALTLLDLAHIDKQIQEIVL